MEGTTSHHVSDPTNNNGSNGDWNSKRVSDYSKRVSDDSKRVSEDSKNNEVSNSTSKEKDEEEKIPQNTEQFCKSSKFLFEVSLNSLNSIA